MIVEVALYHAPQPFPNFRQWLMHEPPKYLPDLLQFGQESLTDGLAQHEEFAVLPGLSTNMREPQKVKCFRLSFPSLLQVRCGKTPEYLDVVPVRTSAVVPSILGETALRRRDTETPAPCRRHSEPR